LIYSYLLHKIIFIPPLENAYIFPNPTFQMLLSTRKIAYSSAGNDGTNVSLVNNSSVASISF